MADAADDNSGISGGLRRFWSRRREATESSSHELTTTGTARSRPAISSAQLQALFAHAEEPAALLSAFAYGVAGLPGELQGMGERLQSAHADGDWPRYGRAMRQLIDKYIRTILDEPLSGEAEQLRDLLHQLLAGGIEHLLRDDAALLPQAHALADRVRQWQPAQALDPLGADLKELCLQVGLRTHEVNDAQELMRSLFDLLLENVGELIEDGSWLQDQIGAVRQLLAGPLDRTSLEQTRAGLREVIYKQGLLKQGLAESKASMKDMMVTFVERLDGMASSTGEYHDRITFHAQAIRESRSIAELGKRMEDILQDTADVQAQALRARDSLIEARREVEAAEQRVADLEVELQSVSELVRVDQLTDALNRRGFDELFKRESVRALRSGQTLSLAMLDLDDFRHINAAHGHLGGDAALCHVVVMARATLRASDAIARFGGEEFVLLLPDTSFLEATGTLERLRGRLAHKPLIHDGRGVMVTFSAGVARWRPGESQDELLARADRAMYQAKQAGKDRIVAAEE
ncbi:MULTISPECIES: GGDEF domain-containing protein [unclassified Pseudoxanthomonas]|uniref:GGDEF domain-containing protein n=1 Tax=unclassified Pseudoxanthomonas TaxID=2645906 RepID=UPI0008E2DD20|nr:MULTISPECIES: GGDEF domain-containing protein [unclassified Pseudoxanthomonas]PPJ43402.1 GGDEF domain-containing protein [Pseudoxanthomonas sp. KAs_5_3]SFV35127.1 diguanylate cyclase (GGDEF) domain-containing protein [Pseudoxanthomonas sp. YR558]